MIQSSAATALVMQIVYMKPGRFRETRVFMVQPGRIAKRNCVIIGGNIINNSKATNAASPLMRGGRAIWYIRRHLQRDHNILYHSSGERNYVQAHVYLLRNCISKPYCVYSTPSSPSISFPFPFLGFFFQTTVPNEIVKKASTAFSICDQVMRRLAIHIFHVAIKLNVVNFVFKHHQLT